MARPDESLTPVACEEARAAWFESSLDHPSDALEDPAFDAGSPIAEPAVREHVESCEGCQAFTAAVAQDQLDLAGWMKGQVVPPPPPRVEFRRTPLHAASGYPRRVSLAIIPLMWGLILLVSLGVIAFGWVAIQQWILP